MFKKIIFVMFSLIFVLSACAPLAATPEKMMDKPTQSMPVKPTEAMMEKPTATPDAMLTKPTDAMMDKPAVTPELMGDKKMDAPAWLGIALTNVNTGQTFTLNDFNGKVVLVENLAMWCPNCKKQQMQVKALHELLGMNKDLISIGLDIDANENAVDLKTYTKNNGFDWIYAVAPAALTREIGKLFGDQFLNPSSTPIVIIDRKGEAHPMPFGIKSAEELKKFIEPFHSASK